MYLHFAIFFYKKRYLTIDRQYFPREGQVRAVRIHAAGIRQVVIPAGEAKLISAMGHSPALFDWYMDDFYKNFFMKAAPRLFIRN